MANFINKIKIGNVEYNIGMANAIHFEGTAVVSTWFSDSACTAAATVADLKNDFLYYNAAKIGDAVVEPGCMYLPLDGTSNTGYELVCVELADGISKWSVLGKVNSKTKEITTSVGTEGGQVIDDITTSAVEVIKSVSVSDANKVSVVSALDTAAVSVITSAPTSAAVSAQTAVKAVEGKDATLTYVKSISKGDVVANHVTSAAPVKADVSGGSVTVQKGDVEIACNEATGAAGKVDITLSNANKTVATGVTVSKAAAVQSCAYENFGKDTYKVENATLILPTSILTAATTASYATNAAAATTSVAIPSAAAMASNVITAVNASAVTHTINVVTGAEYANPTVSLPTQVVTGVTYTAPAATTGDQAIVSSVSATTATFGAVATDAKLIASVPYASKTVATGGKNADVLQGVTVATTSLNNVTTYTKATVITKVTQNTGTVVTAAE